jgi:hypothetical protein
MTDSYYIELEEAREILLSRQTFRDELPGFWASHGVEFPAEVLEDLPLVAFLARQLVTFRFEDAVFLQMAERSGLTPLWSPLAQDKFTVVSSLKRSYVQPHMATGFSKNGDVITKRERLVKDPHTRSQIPLKELVADDGASIMSWHYDRWLRATGDGVCVLDADQFKSGWGDRTDRYYLGLLSLFIAHGVLFEDYHGGESGNALGGFTSRVFEPAFATVEAYFGVKPLVVKLPWWKELAYYPDEQWIETWRERPIPRSQ